MGFMDFFSSSKSIAPSEVRTIIKEKKAEEYVLLDVRQPSEFENGHIPGAILIPLAEVSYRIKELDPEKLTIVYCRSGNRSGSAVSLLNGAGFKDTYNMQGGITAYNGAVASGTPESGSFCFPHSLKPVEIAAIAWFIEDGNIKFLKSLKTASQSVDEIIAEKEANKKSIESLYAEVSGAKPGADFPKGVIDIPSEPVMAGCVKVSKAIEWSKGKTPAEALEALMSLETNSLDLYIRMERLAGMPEARNLFRKLADSAHKHLDALAKALDKAL